MRKLKKVQVVLAAALSVSIATPLLAQYQVVRDGHNADASNLIGANGYNQANGQQYNQGNYINNALIEGNITGGREFRGNSPFRAPDAFRGNLAGSGMDSFVRQSSAAPYGGVPQNNAQVVQPYYGSSYGAPPPTGFVSQSPATGGLVPAQQMVQTQPGDLRLGQTLETPNVVLPQPGQFLMPGPVDPASQSSTVIAASPLYGTRQVTSSSPVGQSLINATPGRSIFDSAGNRMDLARVHEMQEQLLRPTESDTDQQPLKPNPQAVDSAAPKGMESPDNRAISASASVLSNRPLSSSAIGTDSTTGASARQTRVLSSPAQQSTQYAELQKRLQANKMARATPDTGSQTGDKARDQTATPDKNAIPAVPMGPAGSGQNQQTQSGAGTLTPLAPSGGAGAVINPAGAPTGAAPQTPVTPAPGPAAGGAIAAPLQIHSLADGIQNKGLADLLREAESQMKAERYNSAIEQFDFAERVAPNNPMILMGRAIAELGQSYYARSEGHLRQAFSADQALLMGQYDLRSLLGSERLDFLIRELKEISTRESKEPRSVFLLSFIAYNTGNERQAAAYLDLAEKRSGGKDPLFAVIRKHWTLPQDSGTPAPGEMTK